MKDDEIINRVKFALSDWAFEDLSRASAGGAKLATFILASCYIDYLSCYFFNGDSTKNRYITFVNKFLPKYNGRDLYESLRCKLVHNYTEGGKYEFTHDHPELHFSTSPRGRTVLNLNSFLKDLESARDEYFKLVDKNAQFKDKMIARYLKVGIMGPAEL